MVLWGLVVVGCSVFWLGMFVLGMLVVVLEMLYLFGCVLCLGVGVWVLWCGDV